MNIKKYKATEGTLSYIFNTELECDTFILSNPTYKKGEYQEDIKVYLDNLLQRNLNFGSQLVNTFLLDNYNLPQSFRIEDSIGLMVKFENIIKLCQLGDIKNISYLLPTILVDSIFTQERKDKYIEMINQHLTK